MKSCRTHPKEGVGHWPVKFGREIPPFPPCVILHDFLLSLEHLLSRDVEKKQQAHSYLSPDSFQDKILCAGG